ncbi:hypothetical protein [Burkholderia sp. Ac-20365]|uniref:hypothetical protein n=1 Tax=Burkholderia sp. Ac-20365 TaxID=2703897 RepID=UPI00197C5AE5|nr:hypothetical protein [Burkholderia sp. Ac-20365]MBN3760968.1 hypothetical protein [Burkholderia sp. Ac-20365]
MKNVIAKVQAFVRAVVVLFVTPRDSGLVREICNYRFATAGKMHSVLISGIAISALVFIYMILSAAMMNVDVNFRFMVTFACSQTALLVISFIALSWYYSAMCNPEVILARRRLEGRL